MCLHQCLSAELDKLNEKVLEMGICNLYIATSRRLEKKIMTERIKRNIGMLNAIHSCSKEDKKLLLKAAKPDLVKAVCDCVVNVVHGRVPISNQVKGKLRKKIKVLKELTNPRKSTARKKKLLVQHGGGLLSSILGPIIKTIAGALEI
jgi:hypothetical protein